MREEKQTGRQRGEVEPQTGAAPHGVEGGRDQAQLVAVAAAPTDPITNKVLIENIASS